KQRMRTNSTESLDSSNGGVQGYQAYAAQRVFPGPSSEAQYQQRALPAYNKPIPAIPPHGVAQSHALKAEFAKLSMEAKNRPLASSTQSLNLSISTQQPGNAVQHKQNFYDAPYNNTS
ncbi:hypothetical protein Ciccas_014419, partial [Cichlidogyrus casuarinus]